MTWEIILPNQKAGLKNDPESINELSDEYSIKWYVYLSYLDRNLLFFRNHYNKPEECHSHSDRNHLIEVLFIRRNISPNLYLIVSMISLYRGMVWV